MGQVGGVVFAEEGVVGLFGRTNFDRFGHAASGHNDTAESLWWRGHGRVEQEWDKLRCFRPSSWRLEGFGIGLCWRKESNRS